MGNFARKIIDAVQNSMLDRLAVQLLPLLWISSMWEQLSPSESGAGSLILILGVIGLLMLHWLLGAIADRPPMPRRRTPYDSLHEHSGSSLGAWEQQPEGGLRPPTLIRSLVMMLGVRGRRWVTVIEVLMFFCAFALAWMLARQSGTFRSGVHQGLEQQALREQIFLAASMIVTVLSIRFWAVEQRQRLHPSPPPDHPAFSSVLVGIVFTAFLGVILSDLFGFGLLPGLIGGPGLLAIALLPPWRTKVLDFLFGKREPADG
ncbi:MAG: hypothetical protein Q8M32_03740, partial [Brevundimonas sp.]|nr:hypothetical protein [Brevundimonas sp.]